MSPNETPAFGWDTDAMANQYLRKRRGDFPQAKPDNAAAVGAEGLDRHGADALQLVTLDQIAAWAQVCKRTMQRYVKRMPPPYRAPNHGRAALWEWHVVRPWLMEYFGMSRLPDRLPTY